MIPLAQNEGAVAIGISDAAPVQTEVFHNFTKWVYSGASAEMAYMRKYLVERQNPRSAGVLKQADAVVSIAFPYGPVAGLPPIWDYIAEHAKGRDYHKTIRSKLQRIASGIVSVLPDLVWRVFVDSAPVMERAWAVRCGIGVPGRSGMVIVPGIGAKVLLGEIILKHPSIKARSIPSFVKEQFPLCADCNRCLTACPTGALQTDGTVNASKCLSYLTIEKHTLVPPTSILESTDKLFGCDKCVSVCPQNRSHRTIVEKPLIAEPAASLEKLALMPATELQQRLMGTCMYRTGAHQLQQTARQILRNYG